MTKLIPLLAAGLLLQGCAVQVQRNATVDKGGQGLLLRGSGGAPDLRRGQIALRAGRGAEAERELLPLAAAGYGEAQLALGRLYTLADPPRPASALQWLRAAAAQGDVRAEVPLALALMHDGDAASLAEAQRLLRRAWQERRDPEALAGLIQLYTEEPDLDGAGQVAALVGEAEQADAPQTREAVIGWYRATPELEQHPSKLVELCRRSLTLAPQCYVDLVRDARSRGVAAAPQELADQALARYRAGGAPATAGADYLLVARSADPAAEKPVTANVLASLARALVEQQEPAASARPELANQLLAQLADGPPQTQVQFAQAVIAYPYLQPDADVEHKLLAALRQGAPDAALFLGRLYLQGQRVPRDAGQAQRYLEMALRQPDTAVPAHYFLGRLYQYGYLDEMQPELALQHLLLAARHGFAPADGALARLYLNGNGAGISRLHAYVFARLALREGTPLVVQEVKQNIDGADYRYQRIATPQPETPAAPPPAAPSAPPPVPSPEAAGTGLQLPQGFVIPPGMNQPQPPEPPVPAEVRSVDLQQWFQSALTPEQQHAAEDLYAEELERRPKSRRKLMFDTELGSEAQDPEGPA